MSIRHYYQNQTIIFYTIFKGTQVELLRAKLDTVDFKEVYRLRLAAQENLQDLATALKAA